MLTFHAARYSSNAFKRCAVVLTDKGGKLSGDAAEANIFFEKALSRAAVNGRFIGADGQALALSGLSVSRCTQAILIGASSRARYDRMDWVKRGVDIGKSLDAAGVSEATIVLTGDTGKVDATAATTAVLEGIALANYRFDNFKTGLKDHQLGKLQKVTVLVDGKALQSVKEALPKVEGVIAGNMLARDLVNLPPNIATPSYMAETALKLKKEVGLDVDILDKKQLEKLGFNLMLAVGRGAEEEPCLVIMRHKGGNKNAPTHAIVGKGVMFDTGGYNLKPTGYMEAMKCDMAGAAAVMGTMKSLALREVKTNVVGVCPCLMNMVDGKAYLPSDIIKSYKGETVEIGNTDAEGRLALADAIAYTIDQEEPTDVIDLATLTGACMVALGGAYAGLFSNNQRLSSRLKAAGEQTAERLWPMPVDDFYAAKTQLADINNDGSRYGGASTAAVFLKKFVGKTSWAHLDIAGVSMDEKVPAPLKLKTATGFGVRLLTEHFEQLAAEENAPKSNKRGPGRPPKIKN